MCADLFCFLLNFLWHWMAYCHVYKLLLRAKDFRPAFNACFRTNTCHFMRSKKLHRLVGKWAFFLKKSPTVQWTLHIGMSSHNVDYTVVWLHLIWRRERTHVWCMRVRRGALLYIHVWSLVCACSVRCSTVHSVLCQDWCEFLATVACNIINSENIRII